MAKVTIEREGDEDGYQRARLTVKVDGVTVGGGGIGGEPEDNCERRDYSWIRPLIARLSKALGAEVETVAVKSEDDDG
jgi:hypothetical protein